MTVLLLAPSPAPSRPPSHAPSRSAPPCARPWSIRRAEEEDRAGIEAMFGRCAQRTRYRRFHGLARAIPARYLAEALSSHPDHYAVVACAPCETAPAGEAVEVTVKIQA